MAALAAPSAKLGGLRYLNHTIIHSRKMKITDNGRACMQIMGVLNIQG